MANANTGAQPKKARFDIRRYLRDVRGEIKKVSWPNRKQIINNTLIVVIVMAICAVIVGAMDSVFGYIVRFILNKA